MPAARLKKITLPVFGVAEALPPIPLETYQGRIEALLDRMRAADLDVLVVYGDREHTANLTHLTGFDPRFEEALLLLDTAGARRLLVGNECLGYLPDEGLSITAELYQELSLLGQDRDASRPLRTILADFGVRAGSRVGCVGWKYFDRRAFERPEQAIELPSYIVDALRALAGDPALVRNANALLMNPVDGLRLCHGADQIARCEFAAIRTSQSVRALVEGITPGQAEREAARHLDSAGLTLTCHPMVSFGDKVRRGLSSPSGRRAVRGDAFTVAFGIEGALSCRAGVVAEDASELAGELADFFPRYAANYFEVVATWYAAMALGAVGGAVFDAVEAVRDPGLFEFLVNPGHAIHLEEWVSSPFFAGSTARLRSGMILQMDIIPVSVGPFCYTNVEDGIALADQALREELADRFPACWSRIQARREFMRHAIGIPLDPCVLPLSNTPAWLAPYAMATERAFSFV